MNPPGARFFGTTRGRIVALLRRGPSTVEELARGVDLTNNAIRSHLARLERDGLIRQAGVRRGEGVGKPAHLYEIHPDGDALFSRAYAPVLGALLDELGERLPARSTNAIMNGVGRRLAGRSRALGGDMRSRLETAASLLTALGGDVKVERGRGGWSIRGCACPLSEVTATRPDACRAVAAALSEIVGTPVRETCNRGDRPHCCFTAA
jgi:predicted ArsR family transcriptional regulator